MNDDDEKDEKEHLRIDCPGDKAPDAEEVFGGGENPHRVRRRTKWNNFRSRLMALKDKNFVLVVATNS